MRYDFSAEFLRIVPPDTSFGEAWESLCELLLRSELGANNLIRLKPPDCGIDLLYRSANKAFQCKASERGAQGTIDAEQSALSLETAIYYKESFEWINYCFATNADYTGLGYKKILDRAKTAGLNPRDLEFLGPSYWDQLCITHADLVEGRFDYRVAVDDFRLLKTFLDQSQLQIRPDRSVEKESDCLVVANNLNEVELELPKMSRLSVETYINITAELLGLAPFLSGNLGAVLRPLISLKFRGRDLDATDSIGDLHIGQGDKLELHLDLEQETRAIFEAMIEQIPGNVVPQINQAQLFAALGRFREALLTYETIIAGDPSNIIARVGQAEVLTAIGKFDKALRTYENIINEHPTDVLAKTGRAEVLKAQGQFDAALAVYDELIRQHPENVVAQTGRTEILEAQGQFDAALAAYDELIRQHPENVVAQGGRAEVLSGDSHLDNNDVSKKADTTVQPTDESLQRLLVSHIEGVLQDRIWRAAKKLRLSEAGGNQQHDECAKLAA